MNLYQLFYSKKYKKNLSKLKKNINVYTVNIINRVKYDDEKSILFSFS